MSSGTSPSPRRTQGSPPHPGLGPQPRTSAGKHASKPFRSRKRLPVVDVLRQTIGNGPQRRRVVGQPHVTALHRNAFRQACRGFTARLPWNDTVVPGVDRRGRNGNRRSLFGFDAVDRRQYRVITGQTSVERSDSRLLQTGETERTSECHYLTHRIRQVPRQLSSVDTAQTPADHRHLLLVSICYLGQCGRQSVDHRRRRAGVQTQIPTVNPVSEKAQVCPSARESTRPTSAIRGERGPDARPHAVIEVTKEPREAVKRCRPVRASARSDTSPRMVAPEQAGRLHESASIAGPNRIRSRRNRSPRLPQLRTPELLSAGCPCRGRRGVAVPRAVCSTRGTLSSSATGSEPGTRSAHRFVTKGLSTTRTLCDPEH